MGERTLREEAERNFFIDDFKADITDFEDMLEKAFISGYKKGYESGLEFAQVMLEENTGS